MSDRKTRKSETAKRDAVSIYVENQYGPINYLRLSEEDYQKLYDRIRNDIKENKDISEEELKHDVLNIMRSTMLKTEEELKREIKDEIMQDVERIFYEKLQETLDQFNNGVKKNIASGCSPNDAAYIENVELVKAIRAFESRMQEARIDRETAAVQEPAAEVGFEIIEDEKAVDAITYYEKGALCYNNGNYEDAIEWFVKAVENGHVKANWVLGVCYEYGRGVEQNDSEAVKWYIKGAKQGDCDAKNNLGECYLKGKGVEKNYGEAVRWYFEAAQQGDVCAQYNLGVCYENGYAVETSQVEAIKWYKKVVKSKTVLSKIAKCNIARLKMDFPTLQNYNKEEFEIDGTTLVRYHGHAKYVCVPIGVTNIGMSAFRQNESLMSVLLPDSVIEIEMAAFYSCTSLIDINIPNGVKIINERAFYNCCSLHNIEIPSSVTYIGYSCFSYCNKLDAILVDKANEKYHSEHDCLIDTKRRELIVGCCRSVIPTDGSVTSIGAEAFSGCVGLVNINIPDCVETIGDAAFSRCTNLTNIKIPNVIKVGGGVFSFCRKLESVILSEEIMELPALHRYHIGGSYEDVGFFRECRSLKSVKIPDSITSIDSCTFNGCSSLTSIKIPSHVTGIETRAFWGCHSLTSVEIPKSVRNIDRDVFCGCFALTIYYEAVDDLNLENKYWRKSTYYGKSRCPVVFDCKHNDIADDGCIYVVIDGIRYKIINNEAFVAIQPMDLNCNAIIQSSILYNGMNYKVIGIEQVGAFQNCGKLVSIEIPSSITSIAGSSFSDCQNLTTIKYDGTVAQWNRAIKGTKEHLHISIHCLNGKTKL